MFENFKSADSVAYATAKDDGRTIRGGTTQDKRDMWPVGREQELNVGDDRHARRGVNRHSSTAQLSISLGPWICCGVDVHLGSGLIVCLARNHSLLVDLTSGASYGLTTGGKGGMIYTYLGGLFGFSFVILSMAEMASMCVTQRFFHSPTSALTYPQGSDIWRPIPLGL